MRKLCRVLSGATFMITGAILQSIYAPLLNPDTINRFGLSEALDRVGMSALLTMALGILFVFLGVIILIIAAFTPVAEKDCAASVGTSDEIEDLL